MLFHGWEYHHPRGWPGIGEVLDELRREVGITPGHEPRDTTGLKRAIERLEAIFHGNLNIRTKRPWKIDSRIVKVLEVANRRMTGREIWGTLLEQDPNTAWRTVRGRLAVLVKEDVLDNDQNADPPGYGLAKWKNRPNR
jgi:hypothetical protein